VFSVAILSRKPKKRGHLERLKSSGLRKLTGYRRKGFGCAFIYGYNQQKQIPFGDDKQELQLQIQRQRQPQKQKQIQGFFAALRMTGEKDGFAITKYTARIIPFLGVGGG
jgi:hypothetical protein